MIAAERQYWGPPAPELKNHLLYNGSPLDDHKEVNWNTQCFVHLLFVPVHMIALPAHIGKFSTHWAGLITGTTLSRNATLSGDRDSRTELRRFLMSQDNEKWWNINLYCSRLLQLCGQRVHSFGQPRSQGLSSYRRIVRARRGR